MYRLYYTKQAKTDAKKLAESNMKKKVMALLEIFEKDPFAEYPPFEKLIGDLTGAFSRRINIQHRIIYQVLEKEKIIKILRMWIHYE